MYFKVFNAKLRTFDINHSFYSIKNRIKKQDTFHHNEINEKHS